MKFKWFKIVLFVVVFSIIFYLYYAFGINRFLTLENLKNHQFEFSEYYKNNSLLVIVYFSLAYILAVAFSFPGASIASLAAGAIFGLKIGTILVSLCSTVGATLAFFSARYFFRDLIQNSFKNKFVLINKGIEKEGIFYLFTLRLIPVFPFFLINLLMGLTSISIFSYFWVSLVGMFPGTLVYVLAGTQLSKINTLQDISSPTILGSLVLLGVIPFVLKFLLSRYKLNINLRKFKKPKVFDYNIIVIGAGSAGLVSSYISSAVKAKVLLIEKEKMGGDCLNTGCIPSKALIKSAKIAKIMKNSIDYGIEASEVMVNFARVMERVQEVIKKVEPHDSVERYSEFGVECLKGSAFINTPYEVEVSGKKFSTKNIIVATGAKPLIPNIPGLKEIDFLTSDNIWSLRELPEKLLVLGGGPIGCELAQCFARFGSKVTIVEMSAQLLSKEDEDVSKIILEKFNEERITVLTEHKALRVDAKNRTLICEFEGKEVLLEFDKILIALGRRANVSGFGLEKLNVEISAHGTIVADEYLRTTNYPNIYVCGDVTGPFQFTHSASFQAWFASINALFGFIKKFKIDYRVIPWSTFIDPEVARVGLNEKEANEQNIKYQVNKFEIKELDRAIVDGSDFGFVKVLTKPSTDKILGVTIVGSHAGDVIGEYVQAMKYGLGMNKILGTIHIYPTFSESNKYVAGVWRKRNAPRKILAILEKIHKWRRG